MRIVRENATPAIVNITGNTCAAGIFVIHALHCGYAIAVIATQRRRLKPRCTDSESRFLAIKKFSCWTASRLIGARQTRFFARIADADSRGDFCARATRRRSW
jgi:hypothetical protein